MKSHQLSSEVETGMRALGVETEDQLVRFCGDPSRGETHRATACLLVGRLRLRSALPMLMGVACLERPDLLVWESLSAIGAVKSRTVTRPLLRLLKTADSATKRHGIVFALSQLRDGRARGALSQLLLDQGEDISVREVAAEALGLITPSKRSLSALLEALNDDSPRIRYSAVCALGALRDEDAVAALRTATQDKAVLEGEGTVGARASLVLEEIRTFVERRRTSRRMRPRNRRITSPRGSLPLRPGPPGGA